MSTRFRSRIFLVALTSLLASNGFSESLSLAEALNLAKERNGTIRAARFSLESSKTGLAQARTAYLPSVTPSYTYTTNRSEFYTGPLSSGGDAGSTLDVEATWRLLDSGSRKLNIKSQSATVESQYASAVQTYRQTMFSVIRSYYESLRAQELVRVQKAQVERADTLLKRTLAEIEVKKSAGKDRFQPQADLLNAQVALLNAQSRLRTAQAELKSIIGLPVTSTELLELDSVDEVKLDPLGKSLAEFQEEAIQKRPDLMSQRSRLEGQKISIRLAELDAGITYRVDASYTRSFARDVRDRTQLGLVASLPLFDGQASKLEVKGRKLSYQASLESLRQAERDVQSEVEAAHYEYVLSEQRVVAAEAALLAAEKNYEAVDGAKREGIGTIVDVVVASTTLTTAQVNRVETVYDALIAEARWKLAIGAPFEGE